MKVFFLGFKTKEVNVHKEQRNLERLTGKNLRWF